jgi:multidrug efflux pump subunit AcrA (membrane-fusion protein)
VGAEKVAVTLAVLFNVTWQLPLPEQAPDQPPNVALVPGVSVKLTTVDGVNNAEHVPGQLIPVGLLVTVPVPVPAKVTFSVS